MASLLTQTAQEMLHSLGIAESDVLQRVHRGLLTGGIFNAAESEWVVRRLAELSQWRQPDAIVSH
jgi:hypothetical protein